MKFKAGWYGMRSLCSAESVTFSEEVALHLSNSVIILKLS